MKPKPAVALYVAATLVGAVTVAAQLMSAPTQPRELSAAGKAALTQQLSDSVHRGDAPGIAALVVDREGVLFEGAAGQLDIAKGTPMPANAILSIASMTKPVTSVAIMMLMEAGKLKLDDPVSTYLDGYDNLQVISKFNEKDATYKTRPARKAMTIRQLLAHTSGIGYSFTNPIEFALVNKTQKGEWELPLLDEPGDEVALQRQHTRARFHRREGDGGAARTLVPGAHLRPARHGRYAVRGGAGQAVACGDAYTRPAARLRRCR